MVNVAQIASATLQNQQVSSPPGSEEQSDSKKTSGTFDELLKSYFPEDKENMVSEEELFAGVIGERLRALKGEDAQKAFQKAYSAAKQSTKRPDGVTLCEKSAVMALKQVGNELNIPAADLNTVYSESFAAAQLDENHAELWDRRGSGKDPSIAIAKMEAALISVKSHLDAIASGKEKVKALKLDGYDKTVKPAVVAKDPIEPKGHLVDGNGGFLFRPTTSEGGRLAIFTPDSMVRQVQAVTLKDSAGKVIEQGTSEGFSSGSEREKFLFSKKGADFPKNITVEIKLDSGAVQRYLIADPSQRYD